MRILFVASEVVPFSKTGGLGDVAGALPDALARRGHEVVVATPRYGGIDPDKRGLVRLSPTVRAASERAALFATPVKEGRARVVFLEHERFFGSRLGLYGGGSDFPDNAQRFAFLCRAALDLPRALDLAPQIVHLHDWQAALGAWMLRYEHGHKPWAAGARSVYTIHNLAYQGVFPKEAVPSLGLPWDLFRYEALEFYDQLSFMKAGLVFADAITTVSPTYAREILTPEQGCALDALLRARSGSLRGILNGIDEAETWNPARDRFLPAPFDAADLGGKAECKRALQAELGLPDRPETPVVAMVGRFVEQKGLDLVAAAMPFLTGQDLQLVVLGSGAREYEELFLRAAREQPDRVASVIRFDEALAHRMEAGADLFLMPSRYEPCGLNQMYSLRYGTVPVVHAVGGLADTVEDYDGRYRGTGFTFQRYDARDLVTALRRALDVYRDESAWFGIMERGMAQDNSWAHSAASYERLFEELLSRPPHTDGVSQPR